MQGKREFLLLPVSRGLKFLVITNSALIYINIFTMGWCEVFIYIEREREKKINMETYPMCKNSEMKTVEAAVLHK